MIGGTAEWKTSDALVRRLKEIREATRPGSRTQARAMGDIKKLVEEDHRDKLTRGVDRYGRPMEPAAPSTEAQPGRCPGKVMVPCGPRSWPFRAFVCGWRLQGDNTTVIEAKYEYDPKIVQAHEKGARKPGTKWRLPARPTMGITPKGWAAIKKRVKQLAEDIRIGGR